MTENSFSKILDAVDNLSVSLYEDIKQISQKTFDLINTTDLLVHDKHVSAKTLQTLLLMQMLKHRLFNDINIQIDDCHAKSIKKSLTVMKFSKKKNVS